MSLLRKGTETVTLFPEMTTTDSDGNQVTRAGSVGIVVKASVQPISSTENTDAGAVNTETRYRLRLAGGFPTGGGILGSHARVEWREKLYAVEGEAQLHTGSRRTSHATYVMVRS